MELIKSSEESLSRNEIVDLLNESAQENQNEMEEKEEESEARI